VITLDASQRRAVGDSLAEVGPSQVLAEVGSSQVGVAEICLAEVRPSRRCPAQVGAGQCAPGLGRLAAGLLRSGRCVPAMLRSGRRDSGSSARA